MADPKAGSSWRKDQVILVIKNIHHCNKRFPSYEYVRETYPEVLAGALKCFRAWEDAIIAADVICPPFDNDMYFDHDLCVWAHDGLNEPVDRRFA